MIGRLVRWLGRPRNGAAPTPEIHSAALEEALSPAGSPSWNLRHAARTLGALRMGYALYLAGTGAGTLTRREMAELARHASRHLEWFAAQLDFDTTQWDVEIPDSPEDLAGGQP